MVNRLSHITFIVSNLERSALFFKKVFGAKEIYSSGNRTFSLSEEKFFLINDLWVCLMEGDPSVGRTYDHIAFQIHESEYDTYLMLLKDANIEILPDRKRVAGEGRSIYFCDFDNHLFELHAGSLDERLARYLQNESWR